MNRHTFDELMDHYRPHVLAASTEELESFIDGDGDADAPTREVLRLLAAKEVARRANLAC